MATMAEIHEASHEEDAVSKMLLIADYQPEAGTFMRTDGGVTSFMRLDQICIVDQPVSTIGEWAEMVASGISNRALRPGSIVSWNWFPSKNIDSFIDEYRKQGGDNHPLLKTMEEDRINFLKEGAQRAILEYPGTDATLQTRNPQVLMGITMFPETGITGARAASGWLAGLFGGENPTSEKGLQAVRKDLDKEVRNAVELLAQKFTTFGAGVHRVTEDDYIRSVRSMVYPRSGAEASLSDDIDHPIFDRVPIGDVSSVSSQGYVFTDGVYVKCITLNGAPKGSVPGLLSMPSKKVGGASLVDLLDKGWITCNARVRDADEDRSIISDRLKRVSGGSVLDGQAEQILKDTRRAQVLMDRDHRFMFDTELIVCIWDENLENLEDRARRLTTLMSDLVCRMRLETKAAPAFFFRSLPGNSFPPLDGARRTHTWPDRHIVDLLPIWSRSQGTGEGMSLLIGTTGMPFKLSPFGSGGTVAHLAIAGVTGTGKSVLANLIQRDNLRNPLAQGIYLDKGRSFRTAVMSMGEQGLYCNVAKGSFCTNPLEGSIFDVRDVGATFIEHLATPTEDQPLSAFQKGLLDQAISETFRKNREGLEDIGFINFQDPLIKYPGTYLHSATKYLPAEPVSDRQAASLENILADRDPQDRPYIYSVYRLEGLSTPSGNISHPTRLQISSEQEHWMTAKGYLIEDDPETGLPMVLHAGKNAESGPDALGVLLERDVTRVMVNAPKREHVQTLISGGVKFQIPTDMRVERAQRERQAIAVEMPAATSEYTDRRIQKAVESLSGLDLYDVTEGRMTLQREVFIGDIGRYLEDTSEDPDETTSSAASELVIRLSGWYGTGVKSSFFDGPSTVNMENFKLMDFELASLAEQASDHLVSAVVGGIIRMITAYATSPTRKSQRLLVIADEVWQLLRYPIIAQSLETLVRVGRKSGTAVGVCTQSLKDLTDIPAGEALIGNMPNRYVLRQPETDIPVIIERFQLTPEEGAILAGIRSRPGVYSQVMVMAKDQTPRICDVAMVILTPTELWTWTSKREEVQLRDEMIETLVSEGVPDGDARSQVIEQLAKKFRRGLNQDAIRALNQRKAAAVAMGI